MDDMNRVTFTCQDVEQRIEEAVDGSLASDEAEALQAHVSICAPCRLQLDRAKQVIRGLMATSRAAEAAADHDSLLASRLALDHIMRLQPSATCWHRRRFWFLCLAWIGALLLMIRALTGAGKATIERAEAWLNSGLLGDAVAIVGIPPVYWLMAFILGVAALVLGAIQMTRSR
jgi:hypothetical protein